MVSARPTDFSSTWLLAATTYISVTSVSEAGTVAFANPCAFAVTDAATFTRAI
jgi:hypothetical protein